VENEWRGYPFWIRLSMALLGRGIERRSLIKQKQVAASTPKPDRFTVSAALNSLVEKDGDDYEAALLVIRFAADLPLSSSKIKTSISYEENKSQFTGFTPDFGNVTIQNQGSQEEEKVVMGTRVEESIGQYRLCRKLWMLQFKHYTTFRTSGMRSDSSTPHLYYLQFFDDLRPISFTRLDFITTRYWRGVAHKSTPTVLHTY